MVEGRATQEQLPGEIYSLSNGAGVGDIIFPPPVEMTVGNIQEN